MGLTHCLGQDCPLRHCCLRHTKEIFGRQDFFSLAPYDTEQVRCDYFYDEMPNERAIQQLAYQLWQNEGCPDGKATEHWLYARKLLIMKARIA